MAWQRKAWLGKARRDKASHFVAREVKAWIVKAGLG
jgi:predicted Co/Zn/Cd cation transporter (cation efflux family)